MRILVDTNVVSELRRRQRAAQSVVAWSERIDAADLHLSVVSLLELERGALLVARRDAAQGGALSQWIEGQVIPSFGGRLLPVDVAVARRAARLHVPDPRPDRDALIGATALVHRLTLATRNVRDFASMGVPIVNPWEA